MSPSVERLARDHQTASIGLSRRQNPAQCSSHVHLADNRARDDASDRARDDADDRARDDADDRARDEAAAEPSRTERGRCARLR